MNAEDFICLRVNEQANRTLQRFTFTSEAVRAAADDFNNNVQRAGHLLEVPSWIHCAVQAQEECRKKAAQEVTGDPNWKHETADGETKNAVSQRYIELYKEYIQHPLFDTFGGGLGLIHVEWMNTVLPFASAFRTLAISYIVLIWVAYETLEADLARIYKKRKKRDEFENLKKDTRISIFKKLRNYIMHENGVVSIDMLKETDLTGFTASGSGKPILLKPGLVNEKIDKLVDAALDLIKAANQI